MLRALARFRQRVLWGFPAPDVVLAGVLCLVAVLSVLTGNPAEGPVVVTLPVAVVSTVALLWRRRGPMVTTALIVLSGTAQTVLSQPPGSLWSLVVYVVTMYSLAAYLPEGTAAIAGAVFVAALLIQERIGDGVDYVFILLLFGGVWVLGRASQRWRGRVSTAERRQREAARLAVAEERLRIARDLHDVVAHSLSVIAVQSDAAEAVLATAPERAVEPVRAIRTTAREALTEIRRVLDVLRADDDLPNSGSPGVAAVAALVESARSAGASVAVTERLGDVPLPPEVDLAAYRIVQECLTNVLKHAPGAAVAIAIEQAADRLVVRVTNSLPGSPAAGSEGSGYGISGMRERAEALGGTLDAGAAAGRFEVQAILPLLPQEAER